jgi:hypothetical protein
VANTGLTGTKRLKPVAFSRVTDEIRARFAHDALAVLGPVHSITINLGDEVLAQAYRKRNFADWIGRRIKRALKEAFGRVIDLYLVLEEVCEDKRTGRETIRPHFHGEIAISADEAELARKVIRKAVGEWEIGRRQFQVITEANPDFDWASYATKQAWKATPSMRARLLGFGAGRRYVLSFQGGVFTATRDVLAKAAELYSAAAKDVLAARRGELTIGDPPASTPAHHRTKEPKVTVPTMDDLVADAAPPNRSRSTTECWRIPSPRYLADEGKALVRRLDPPAGGELQPQPWYSRGPPLRSDPFSLPQCYRPRAMPPLCASGMKALSLAAGALAKLHALQHTALGLNRHVDEQALPKIVIDQFTDAEIAEIRAGTGEEDVMGAEPIEEGPIDLTEPIPGSPSATVVDDDEIVVLGDEGDEDEEPVPTLLPAARADEDGHRLVRDAR